MILLSLPDNVTAHPFLKIGEDYPILAVFNNGYIIQPDGCKDRLILVASRFAPDAR